MQDPGESPSLYSRRDSVAVRDSLLFRGRQDVEVGFAVWAGRVSFDPHIKALDDKNVQGRVPEGRGFDGM